MRACFNDLNGDNDSNHATLVGLEQTAQQLHKRFSEEVMYKSFVDEVLGFDSSIIETKNEELVLEFE